MLQRIDTPTLAPWWGSGAVMGAVMGTVISTVTVTTQRARSTRRYRMRAEASVTVEATLTVGAAHDIAVAAEHAVIHAVPKLDAATVHLDPRAPDGVDPHAGLRRHAGR